VARSLQQLLESISEQVSPWQNDEFASFRSDVCAGHSSPSALQWALAVQQACWSLSNAHTSVLHLACTSSLLNVMAGPQEKVALLQFAGGTQHLVLSVVSQ
jgi:hypothetical protein